MSEIFQKVKHAVTAKQAAERYGLKVNRYGMACCPFHTDHTPSMKLDERYYCFGCKSSGDSIDLTMQLLGLDAKSAVLQMAEDFGVTVKDENEKSERTTKAGSNHLPRGDPEAIPAQWIERAVRIVLCYREVLKYLQDENAPKSMGEEWNELFCRALSEKARVEYLLDELMFCTKDEFKEIKNEYRKDVEAIELYLEQFIRGDVAENC